MARDGLSANDPKRTSSGSAARFNIPKEFNKPLPEFYFEPYDFKLEGGNMGNEYQPELWRDIFIVLSSSSAALIGLLFIATSLRLEEIVNNPVLRRRAFNHTRYLLTIFVEALLILIPQPKLFLGIELIALNLLALCLPLRLFYLFFENKEGFHRGGTAVHRLIIFIIGFSLGIAGGATLIEHSNWGIFLVTASCIIVVVMVVLNSWSIMLGLANRK